MALALEVPELVVKLRLPARPNSGMGSDALKSWEDGLVDNSFSAVLPRPCRYLAVIFATTELNHIFLFIR